MARNKKTLPLLLAFMTCIVLIAGISAVVLAADDVTLPEGATFYYQYVITDEDFEAGARFDESYLENVQAKINNGDYVANTIVGIELSADQKTMTIYMGSAAGTEVNSVLQPYEETQPVVKIVNSALAEHEGWTDSNSIQTLSSSYYIGSAVRDYYGQKNTTFTSSLKLKYGFTYTLTLGDGQSIGEDWSSSAIAAIAAGTETGVLALEKSEDGKTYTMYFDAYDFYKTTLSLPAVTLTDTSTQIFGDAWTDGGSNTLSTTDSLAAHLAYTDSGNTASIYATNLTLSPSLVTKTYNLYLDVSDGGSLADGEDYSKYVSGSGSGYTVSKTNDGMLLIKGIQAGETISLNADVINVNSGKLLDSFSVNESSTDSGVSCDISYEGSKWNFGFASTDTNASHTVYAGAVYGDTAQMYVELASDARVDQSGIDGSTDIVSVDSSYSSDGYLILTVRDGAVISFADILIYDGYYTTGTATAGQDGTSASSKVAVTWIEITAATVTTLPTANTLTYTGSAQALVTAGAADGGALYYSLTNTDGDWSLGVPTATEAGSYTVYYKVIGDAYHKDVDPTPVAVTISKADPTVTAPTAVTGLEYTGSAQRLATAGSASNGTLYYSLTGDDWSTELPTATAVGEYTVFYKVVGDENYNDTSAASFQVTIGKGTQTAPDAPTLSARTTSSITVNTVAANANGAAAEYSIDGTTWQSSPAFTGLSAGTAYTISVRYAETDNYKASAAVTASLSTASAASSSSDDDDDDTASSASGSSSSTSTSTTTNADGSTTTTVTDSAAGTVTETTEYTDGTVTTVVTDTVAGTVTETTEYADGSTTTVITEADTGTVTETTEYADGTVVETVTDGETGTITSITERADGSTIVAITDGETGVKTTTETTAENVVIETVADPETNVVATISIPETVDTATVTIPAETSVGTVAVNADTGEIIVLSVATEDGLVVKLDSSANIVLVDNSKEFTDTEGHWAADAIDFATSHELFNGTSEETFSPNEAMTRGMLAQVLYNLEGGPDQVFVDIYGDVLESDWYSAAVSWASDAGVISGYGNGSYGAADSITREQMATILYRYAQLKGYDISVGVDVDIQSYQDHGTISEYAVEAMQWAVGTGLIQGTGEGYLDPLGNATRAQIATIMQRFITNVTAG